MQKQFKLHGQEFSIKLRGNCMMTCYANLLDIDVEDAPPIEELFSTRKPNGFWWTVVQLWFEQMGYSIVHTTNHLEAMNGTCDPDGLYFVSGNTSRSSEVLHMVIYRKGELFHDPHPDNTGVIEPIEFEYLIKNEN